MPARLALTPGRLPRAEGGVDVRFVRRGSLTVLADLYQGGSAKVRFPKVFDGGPPEAVLINLAGGITGADCFRQSVHFGEGTHAVVTTQAAEKIYRAMAEEEPACVDNKVTIEAGGFAEWLPQETIFFDGGRLKRCFEARIDPTARLLACESIVFGRTAMRETVQTGYLDDRWRIYFGDRLIFADGFKVDSAIQRRLNRPAVAGGSRALATVIYVGPDADMLLDRARAVLVDFDRPGRRASISCLGNLLNARFIAADGVLLKAMMIPYIDTIRAATGPVRGLPKLWCC